MAEIYHYLHYTNENATPEELEEAILSGVDVNGTSSEEDYQSALALANYEEAKILIKYGADVNYKDPLGENALFYELLMGKMWHPESVKEKIKLLLDSGIDINALNDENENILFACRTTHDFMFFLNKIDNIFQINKNGWNIAYSIFFWENNDTDKIKVLEILKDKGIDLHILNNENINYLSCTTSKVILKYLINEGLNVNQIDKSGSTLLNSCDDEHIALTLINEGNADIHICDKHGRNALNNLNFYPTVCELMLNMGIEIINFPEDFENMRIFNLVEKKYIERIEDEKKLLKDNIRHDLSKINTNRL